MAVEIREIVDLLQLRLVEVEAERERLEDALAQMGGPLATKRSAREEVRRKKSTTRRSKVRAARGLRRSQFLEAVDRNPGVTIAELTKQVGISANQGYGLARTLIDEGSVRKEGPRYFSSSKKGSADRSVENPKRANKK